MAEDEKRQPDTGESKDQKEEVSFWHAAVNALLRHPRQIGLLFLAFLILLLGGVFFVRKASQAASTAYALQKDSVSDETYRKFYDTIYDAAESSHHVTNKVSISIGSLKEESRLEVLKVSDVVFEVTGSEEEAQGFFLSSLLRRIMDRSVDSWLKVPGSGVFTVDLSAAEFITDDDHEHVLIRMLKPQLTEFAIDYDEVEELYFKDNAIFRNPARVGIDLAIGQLTDAQRDLTAKITSSERFEESACHAAVNIVTGLVRELNQDLPDLVVEVEFME